MRESVRKNKNRLKDFKVYKSSCQNVSGALDYLELHKNCPYGRLEYAKALVRENKTDEAKIVLEELLNTKNYKYALAKLSIIEFCNKNYEACYGYLNRLEKVDLDYYSNEHYRYIKYFCMTQLNIPINIDYRKLDYMENIILKYDKDMVIKHILHHDQNFFVKKNCIENFNELDYDDCFFASNIDVEQLYEDVSNILKLDEVDKNIEHGISSKIYFRYDNVGSNVRGRQDYLVVMILTGTDKIISMYPNQSIEKEYRINKNPVYDFFELKEKAKNMNRAL